MGKRKALRGGKSIVGLFKKIPVVNAAFKSYNRVVDAASVGYGEMSKEILKKYGDVPITSMLIERAPVSSLLTTALNWLSMGQFERNTQKLGYDNLFHLALYAFLSNGVTIKLEKTTHPTFSASSPLNSPGVETMPVDFPPGHIYTINYLTQGALNIEGRDNYFIYSAKDRNCQRFVLALLRGAGLNSYERQNFILQDSKACFEGLSRLRQFSNTVTDVGAIAQKIVGGKVIHRHY